MNKTREEIEKSMVLTSGSFNHDKQGQNMSKENKELVNRLIAQAMELQRRFNLAEKTALILEQMLSTDNGLNEAIDNTYEAHTFATLRMQLFRSLIVDLYAAVFDDNPRTGSVRAILKELRRDTKALDALREYHSDPDCLEIEVTGDNVSAEDITLHTETMKARHRRDAISSFDALWSKIDQNSNILNTDEAQRIKWARVKFVAHFDKTDKGLVAIDDEPDVGEGVLKWGEPTDLLNAIHEYAYDVFLLITRTSWGNDFTSISRFYAEAFWDRLKNGSTDLEPPKL